MKKKFLRITAIFLAINIFFDAVYPTVGLALTGGPKQPEVAGFTPIGTSEMVNAYTGDFNYNIPLMDVGGYPLNLSYQSGISMDQEASWVGLGWSLNPGVIDRSMRSLPDDFNGDKVKKEFNVKPNTTYGIEVEPSFELFGVKIPNDNLSVGLGLTYNNYSGFGFSASLSLSTDAAKTGTTAGLGLSAGSESGVGISPSLSFAGKVESTTNKDRNLSAKVGLAYNSRAGLQALNLSFSAETTKLARNKSGEDHTGSYSFASPTYVPQGGHSMINVNLSVGLKLGGAIFGLHPHGKLKGYFAGQFLKDKDEVSYPAYGYIHSENAGADDALMDFNREKDGAFNEQTPSLPLTNFTYDVYGVSGQGIGGVYRAHRSDVGIVHDVKVVNIGGGADIGGFELGAGSLAHPGLNVELNESNSRTGKWEDDNDAASVLGFKSSGDDAFYEPTYFKKSGEKNAENDQDFFDLMGGFDPVRIELNHNPENVTAHAFYNKAGTNMHKTTRSRRARRNEVISLLTAAEAKKYGEVKEIKSYGSFDVDPTTDGDNVFHPSTFLRTDAYRQDHHTSQITTYREDGARYVYGIPAYNITQDERTFAVEKQNFDQDRLLKGIIDYSAEDNSAKNKKGLDHYFDKTVLPAYAHSYLLTEVLSADYVDVTGNGPTDDDLGTYTKFNYTQTADVYKWRVPYSLANYNKGLESLPANEGGDDKANYIYGEKELWYLHSIETKNYVAEFKLEARADGFGVGDEDGGYSSASAPMQKLKSISLFSKSDLLANKANATPIKTVHFEYDYYLCPGVDNNPHNADISGFPNQGGKLTLQKVYFTYGNSAKGKLSPYEFNYDSFNPSYNLKGYDRWGNYKENTLDNPTAEFPYTDQSQTIADRNASAWHMTGVNLPSGGSIQVSYESDDYAYVQDKRAMQMCSVLGASYDKPTALSDGSDQLYEDLIGGRNLKSRSYLIFKLVDQNISENDMGRLYFNEKDGKEMEDLYFKFRLDLGRNTTSGPTPWEHVPGYAKIDQSNSYGLFIDPHDHQKYGYVHLATEQINDYLKRDPDVNPISQSGWNFTKMNLPVLAYNKPSVAENEFVQIFKSIATTLKSLSTVFNGLYNQMRLEHMSKRFDTGKSYIRLYNPVNSKKGGGCRVKKIALSDNWDDLTKPGTSGSSPYSPAEYGQEYSYTTTDAYGQPISSGVAAYEPLLGGDENPFRQPVPYAILHKLGATDELYQEKPFGESFFPGPSVGYSKVTVKNLHYDDVKKHATGSVVKEFYTAKDFPTIVEQTTLDPVRKKSNAALRLLKIRCRDFMTATQGFLVMLNDMPGKERSTAVYQEGKDKAISGVRYIYKTSLQQVYLPGSVEDPILVGALDNTMLVMEKNGSIGKKMVGVDYDFITDMRESTTISRTAGINGNLEAFLIALFPGIVPTVLPSYAQERVRFRSAVTTKVINRYGLLDQTIAFDQGSVVSTKNKMLDAETGEVLLTETQNQYNDPVYSFSYPAHNAYDGMGSAYKNIGVTVNANATNLSSYFVPGDELEIFDAPFGNYEEKGWVKKIAGTGIEVIDRAGLPINLSGKRLKVLRSGRRNQAGVSVGSVISKASPIKDSDGDGVADVLDVNSSLGILNASAIEFKEDWGMFCECGAGIGDIFNPYVKGTLGNWRSVRSQVYLTDRTQDRVNENTDIRKDGIYISFSPFWRSAGGTIYYPNLWKKDPSNWTFTSEVTVISPFGMELENKDATGIYSSAIYGYNNSMPIAVSANAKYREIGFDGFEDYGMDNCKKDHFSFESTAPAGSISPEKSHTGRKSIKVPSGGTVQVKKVLRACDDPQP